MAQRGGAIFQGGFPYTDFFWASIVGCTIVANRAANGAGLYVESAYPALRISNTIIALNMVGAGIVAAGDGPPAMVCCDIYGNEGGDWTGSVADQINSDGNFSADPCFCSIESEEFSLSGDSWCLPGHHPWGCDDLVGALGEGCPEMGCAGVVPVLIADFVAHVASDGITVSWRVSGHVDAAQLRLVGIAKGSEWEVPFEIGPEGEFSAIDQRGSAMLISGRDANLAYVLQMATGNGWMILHRQEVAAGEWPTVHALALMAIPNPFNPLTTLRFDLPVGGRVHLEVYDVAGRLVRTLLDADLPAGNHQAVWDGKDASGRGMPSGSYFARLSAGRRVETVSIGLVR